MLSLPLFMLTLISSLQSEAWKIEEPSSSSSTNSLLIQAPAVEAAQVSSSSSSFSTSTQKQSYKHQTKFLFETWWMTSRDEWFSTSCFPWYSLWWKLLIFGMTRFFGKSRSIYYTREFYILHYEIRSNWCILTLDIKVKGLVNDSNSDVSQSMTTTTSSCKCF